MNLPTPELGDLAKPVRTKLEKLLYERAVLGYGFSYSKLFKLVSSFMDGNEAAEAIQDCILSTDDASEKDAKDGLNDAISAIYAENDLKSLRSTDPFGRRMDFLLFESRTGSRLDKVKMVEQAPKFNISTKKILELIEASTIEGRPYVTLVARGVKEES